MSWPAVLDYRTVVRKGAVWEHRKAHFLESRLRKAAMAITKRPFLLRSNKPGSMPTRLPGGRGHHLLPRGYGPAFQGSAPGAVAGGDARKLKPADGLVGRGSVHGYSEKRREGEKKQKKKR